MHVSELARLLEAPLEGDGEVEIRSAAPLETAGQGDLAFVASAKMFGTASQSGAGCIVAPAEFPNATRRTILRSAEPRATFARALALLYPAPALEAGVHATATVHPEAQVASSAEIGPRVTIGAGARIEDKCRIGAGSVIGARSVVGAGSLLHANVTIYADVKVGARAVLHSGCVLGADGFGFALQGGRYQKFPQVGTVVLEDDVEIGANSCVDRAALGVTMIGEGTKLDNMVHIGHNCRIGKHVVIAAQTGLSGGVEIGDYAVIGGQVGIGDKARIESGAVLGSGCGILTSKIVRGGQVVWGTPARPLKEHLQQLANISRLPALRDEVADLKRRLAALEAGGTR